MFTLVPSPSPYDKLYKPIYSNIFSSFLFPLSSSPSPSLIGAAHGAAQTDSEQILALKRLVDSLELRQQYETSKLQAARQEIQVRDWTYCN